VSAVSVSEHRCRLASEFEYQLLLAHDLEYLPRDTCSALDEQVAEVKRMLCRFMQSLIPTG
jgi:four helix bundle protein